MNGKKAKLIRKIARRDTIGQPEKAYQKSKKGRYGWILAPHCTRKVTRQFKKAYLISIR